MLGDKSLFVPKPDQTSKLIRVTSAFAGKSDQELLHLVVTLGKAHAHERRRVTFRTRQNSFSFKCVHIVDNAQSLGCFFTNSQVPFTRTQAKECDSGCTLYTWYVLLCFDSCVLNNDIVPANEDKCVFIKSNDTRFYIRF